MSAMIPPAGNAVKVAAGCAYDVDASGVILAGSKGADVMAAVQPTYADRIIRDPEILVGKPVVKGTRIAVEVVLEYLAHNPNFGDLFADYPRLTMEDVRACLDYARALVQEEAKHKGSSRLAKAS